MIDFLKKMFGTKHEKDVKAMRPIVEAINQYFVKFESLSDDELRAKTEEFRNLINSRIEKQKKEIESIYDKLKIGEIDFDEQSHLYARLKEVEDDEFKVIDNTLNEILPQAYAVVKQTCKRLVGHHYLVTGNNHIWDMVPFDVQLMGGITLNIGKIAEMATGEGKTLVAVLPLYLNALPGRGAHLVTVNDYLALRDSEWMYPVFEFLGLTVGVIQSNMEPHERLQMYNCDITYGTNNEFGFDYLRDNMASDMESMVQRKHWYSIVDEVDSVLVDEARTPLIISGPVGAPDTRFEEMKPRVARLVENQTKFVNQIVGEAEKLLPPKNKEDRHEAGVLLLRANRALPKHNKLSKILQDPEYQQLMKEIELEHLRDQGTRMIELDETLYYTIDEKNHNIDISDKGRQLLANAQEEPDLFLIPDVGAEISVFENDPNMPEEEKQRKKAEIMALFSDRTDRIHTVTQLLRAYSLYEIDVEYVVQDGKILIVDEFTGRILDGRRYSEGLHQAIEAKEGVHVERDTQTLATITLQNYFRLYKKLAGMTGTAETEAGEFEKIYNLDVSVIPTNQPITRVDNDDLIYRTKEKKYNAVVVDIQELIKAGRAALVGTTSVEVSELLSKMLTRAGVKHNVLNAKHHQREADIVQNAGRRGSVTIATNMAGRGTDIKLDADVKKSGGLAILGTERHESRRIDRQLRGRAGRQGDPGSSQFFISLEDDLMRLFGGANISAIMQRLKVPEGEAIQHPIITKSVERAQKKVEENNFGIRKRLLEYDNVMNMQREVIYDRRRHALRGERLKSEIFEYLNEIAEEWFTEYVEAEDFTGLKSAALATILVEVELTNDQLKEMKKEAFIAFIVEKAKEFYQNKEEMLGVEFMARLEQAAILQTIDEKWRDHLRGMDEMKEGIHLRAYGQKDPLLEYKGEAYKLFEELIQEINKEAVSFAFKYFPHMIQRRERPAERRYTRREPEIREDGTPAPRNNVSIAGMGQMSFSHPTATNSYNPDEPTATEPSEDKVHTVKRSHKKMGRNDKCPMDPNKKFKDCCGAKGLDYCEHER